MRVPPSGSRPIHNINSSQVDKSAATGKSFDSTLSSSKPVSHVKAAAAEDIMIDVKALAAQVRSGTVSKEEASKRFVSIVIQKRHDLGAFGPKAKQIEEAVQEIAGDDPHFVSRLQAQLQKI